MHMHVRRTCEQQGLAPQHYTQVNPTPELHVLPVASRVAFVPSHPALVGLIVPCVLGARMHLCVLPFSAQNLYYSSVCIMACAMSSSAHTMTHLTVCVASRIAGHAGGSDSPLFALIACCFLCGVVWCDMVWYGTCVTAVLATCVVMHLDVSTVVGSRRMVQVWF